MFLCPGLLLLTLSLAVIAQCLLYNNVYVFNFTYPVGSFHVCRKISFCTPRGKYPKLKTTELFHTYYATPNHMKRIGLKYTHIENYRLGPKFYRQLMKKWVYYAYTYVNMEVYCLDKDIQACTLKLKSTVWNTCVLAPCRVLFGNFSDFLK
jgi:hypothetical protein